MYFQRWRMRNAMLLSAVGRKEDDEGGGGCVVCAAAGVLCMCVARGRG
eukprot:SAG11_NODE_485_length_9035_cov_16.221352_4_plen_48_part_00